jgi:hypothetical protein
MAIGIEFLYEPLMAAVLEVALGEGALPMLKAAVGLQSEEERLLGTIRRDVKALMESPWHTGDLHLKDAIKEWRTDEERLKHVELARRKYLEACGNLDGDASSYSRLFVEYRVAVCWAALGKTADSRDWLEKSRASALVAKWFITEEILRENPAVVLGEAAGLAALNIVPVWGWVASWAIAKGVDRYKAARAAARFKREIAPIDQFLAAIDVPIKGLPKGNIQLPKPTFE